MVSIQTEFHLQGLICVFAVDGILCAALMAIIVEGIAHKNIYLMSLGK